MVMGLFGGSYGALCGGLGVWGAFMGSFGGHLWGPFRGSDGALCGGLGGVVMGPCVEVWGFGVSAKLAMKANRQILEGSVPSALKINPSWKFGGFIPADNELSLHHNPPPESPKCGAMWG